MVSQNPEPWSTESPPFAPPHIHLDNTEDLVSAESQSIKDTDEFRTPDSEDSTDVSNHYRNVRWTDKPQQPSESKDDPEAELEEEGPIRAFQDSPPQLFEAPTPARTPEW